MAQVHVWYLNFLMFLFASFQLSTAPDCPAGWSGFGSSCYKFVARSLSVRGLNWDNARTMCLGYSGDLVSVANRSEMVFLYNMSSRVSNEHYWIGLIYRRNQSAFAWSDGTPYNNTVFQNWHNGKPSDQKKAEDCVELYNSYWKNANCKNEYGYICERPRGLLMPSSQPISPLLTPTPIACPPGWNSYGASCYQHIKVPKKWMDAKDDCRSSGGYLVKIDNEEEELYITLQLRSSSMNAWIGLSDSGHEGIFVWEGDESCVNYSHWGPGAPDNLGGVEDCVEVLSGALAGFWNDDYCDSEKHYICEMPDGQSACPVNWRTFGDSCYQFNVHGSQALTWEMAQEECNSFKGAALISILNAKEQTYVAKELEDISSNQVWLGLNDRKSEGVFKWSDESPVSYLNWAAISPLAGSPPADHDCVVLYPNTDNGTWATTSCTSRKGYICKSKRGINQCNSPLGMENGNIGDGQITASSSQSRSSPSNARLRNIARGSSLSAWCAASNRVGEFLQIDLGVVRRLTHISLQGREKSADYVKSFYVKYGENGRDLTSYGENATIKYKVLEGNSDGHSVKDVILAESIHARFVRIYPLTWSGMICLRAEVYGCSTQAFSKQCGPGWEEGFNNTCYQINSNLWKLWADARATCVNRGGDILSITSVKEKNWMNERLKALSGWVYSFWIGLYNLEGSGCWYWSDGSPFILTSWESGYFEYVGRARCVQIKVASGLWRDFNCGEYRPFICKRKLVTESSVKAPITGNWISGTDYYWPLDRIVDGKALGTVLATVVGNVTIPDEKQNERNCFHFEASHTYLDAGQFTRQCITDPEECHNGISVSFVVRFGDSNQTRTSPTYILDVAGNRIRSTTRGFLVYFANDRLYVVVLSENRFWSVAVSFLVGIWQHVLFTWQRAHGLVVYVNGKERLSSRYGIAASSPLPSAVNPRFIVGGPSGGRGFYLRSLAIWKRRLSAQEAQDINLAEFGSCRVGWKSFGQFCYQFNTERKSWFDARLSCINEKAELVSIHSPVEQAFIDVSSRAPELYLQSSWIWIGLHDQSRETEFEWSDGSVIQYTLWEQYEPNARRSNEDCVHMMHYDARRWNDISCRNTMAFICKKPKELIPEAESSSTTVKPAGCPDGWQSTPHGLRCFGLMLDRKSWKQASAACKTYGAELASIHSSIEDSVVLSLLVNSWDVADVGGIWIGLSGSDQRGMYQWSDNSSLRHTTWLKGEPYCYLRTGCCVRATIQRGMTASLFWQNSACSDALPYVCAKPAKNAQPYTPRPPPIIGRDGQCPYGWMARGQYCYSLVMQKKTWIAASDYCVSNFGEGAVLVSIHSLEENRFVASLFNSSLFAAWLGLSGRGIINGYTWSDSSPVQFTNWSPQEPDSHHGQQPCVEMYSTGEWGDSGCYSVKPFICKVLRPHRQTTAPPATLPTTLPSQPVTTQAPGICPPDWKLWNTMCYDFRPLARSRMVSWHVARYNCRKTKGADLVSVLSSAENSFILSHFHSFKLKLWIGLNDIAHEGTYQWSDGSPVNFTKYELREPNDFEGSEDCTEFLSTGLWNDINCDALMPYVCKAHNNSFSPPEPTTVPTNDTVIWTCKEGWISYGRSCYSIALNEPRTWHMASHLCRHGKDISMHGDLVTINDQYEQAFLTLLLHHLDKNVWIGLSDVSWGYYWADSTPLQYTNWDIDQPSSSWPQGKCVFMTSFRDAGRWKNIPCSTQLEFICEAGAIPVFSTTSPPSAVPRNKTCPDPYEQFGDDCYFVSYVKLTWHEAREACNREGGGNLISVHNPFEQAFLVVSSRNLKGGLWLGLHREANSTEFFWTDHSLRPFTNWAPNQPDAPRNQATCVVANNSLSNAGLWSDVDCSETNGFVCRIRTGEPEVSPPLLGSCPDGWVKFDKSCYLFEEKYLNRWTAALLSCHTQGGDLVSITSPEEQHFLNFNLRKKAETSIWIGLNHRTLGRGYTWSDGSSITYFNWKDSQHKNPAFGMDECVVMDGYGLWVPQDCSAAYGYICKRQLECTGALGMVSGGIRDSQVTGSPSINPAYSPSMARLNSVTAWCADRSQQTTKIQVDLLTESRLTEIATQGFYLAGVSSYVRTFKVQTSDDGVTWKTYKKYGVEQVFVGNRDADTVAKLKLDPPVDTRFVRLLPSLWVNTACVRMELYGCKYVCGKALGMESGEIKDTFLSASSAINQSHVATEARPSGMAWAPKVSDTKPWLEIDFPIDEWKITKITTWGGGQAAGHGYVTVYRLAFKDTSTKWTEYSEGGRIRNFRGNQDCVHPETHVLAEPIITQFLRLIPLFWPMSGVYLRLELFGCQSGCEFPLGLRQGTILDSALSASSSLDQFHGAAKARLNGSTGWCGDDKDKNPYLVVDLGRLMRLRKIAIQGEADGKGYVRTYTIRLKKEVDKPWKTNELDGKPKLFAAGSNGATIVTNTFTSTLHARFIKVQPISWNVRACLRLELYGCEPVPRPSVATPAVLPSARTQSKDVVYTASVRLFKDKWTDDLNDSKSDAFKTLAEKLSSAIMSLYSGIDEPSLAFRQVAVTGFKRGSVIAVFSMTFYRDMAEDAGVDVESKLVLAVKSGKLGELVVDPDSLQFTNNAVFPVPDSKPSIPVEKPTVAARSEASSSSLSTGATVGIAITAFLVLALCAVAFVWWFHRMRKEKTLNYKHYYERQVSYSCKTEETELL